MNIKRKLLLKTMNYRTENNRSERGGEYHMLKK